MTTAVKAAPRTRNRAAAQKAPQLSRAPAPKSRTPTKAPAKKSTRRSAVNALPKFKLTVDDRTVEMTVEALLCRESGHHWNRVPQGLDRRALMAHRGQAETVRVCSTCTSQRIELYWLPSFEPVSAAKYKWSDGYLIAKHLGGGGRLSRSEVRKALFARDNLDLIA